MSDIKDNYSFWKLFLAQWSWRNDRVMLFCNLLAAIFVSLGVVTFSDITYVETGMIVSGHELWVIFLKLVIIIWSTITLGYHLVKVIVMALFCGLICYFLKEKFKDSDKYNELLTWRK